MPACQACHVRKKRCVYTERHRCTNCIRVNQACLPWPRRARASTAHTLKDAGRNPHPTLRISTPSSVDCNVPRWSVMHSLLSEIVRFIPPTGAIRDPIVPPKPTEMIDCGDLCSQTRSSTSLSELIALPIRIHTEDWLQNPKNTFARTKRLRLSPKVGHSKLESGDFNVSPESTCPESTNLRSTTNHPWGSLEELDALLKF